MKSTAWQRERKHYLIGGLLSLILTAVAFIAVMGIELSRPATLAVIAIAGVAQLIVQVRFFLHIDLSRQKREDLHLILFSLLLLTLMAGGTIWIMGDLAGRM
ncbi:cytochrome o ubiquinol oxidase subunit IV [Halomonas garicola]|uniref:cytochrome o ubiquinol oxidase subunit IV n=1 Tax=Halomonas garicola TaxID=1690008 RepID=UPI0028A2C27F|nr:cytochrome o ubiquinol oxidase subunit IV [Halomonas garicola]